MFAKGFFTSCIFVGLTFMACSNRQMAQKNLRDEMLGEWRSVSINVTINTVDNSDSSSVFSADESNWEQKLRMKPIRTFYKEDGTYISEYRNLADSVFSKSSGTWIVRADTLTLNQAQPNPETYKSKVVIKDDLGEFTIRLDWDSDGSADDLYFGVQRKQR